MPPLKPTDIREGKDRAKATKAWVCVRCGEVQERAAAPTACSCGSSKFTPLH